MLMGAEEESRKILNIIDKVNGIWGDEHEKQRKKIFKDNIIIRPFIHFVYGSIPYVTPVLIYIYCDMLSAATGGLPLRMDFITHTVELIFNAPYYLFDIRLGVITSIASLLLSLYVSVGKYVDGLSGLVNDARRMAYRKFARMVGLIVFYVFVVNFWHGLLAGYFRGGVSIPYPFKFLESPGWGKAIVPEDVNLSRYGDMPLWVLLFFAWFALASSLMLTYSEKDALMENLSTLRRINSFMNGTDGSPAVEYTLARRIYDRDKRVGEPAEKYGGDFIDTYGYSGFDFELEIPFGWDRMKFWVIIIIWYSWLIPCFLIYLQYKSLILTAAYVTCFVIVACIGVLSVGKNRNFLFVKVYKFNTHYLKLPQKVLEFVKFWNSSNQLWVVFYALAFFPALILYGAIRNQLQIESNILLLDFKGDWLKDLICLFTTVVAFVMPQVYARLVVRPLYENEFKKYSEKSMEMTLKKMDRKGILKIENLNYLAVAYIYCLMRDVDRLYSEYELEIGSAPVVDDKH
mgnify:FL=1